jgi:hypothetical protein
MRDTATRSFLSNYTRENITPLSFTFHNVNMNYVLLLVLQHYELAWLWFHLMLQPIIIISLHGLDHYVILFCLIRKIRKISIYLHHSYASASCLRTHLPLFCGTGPMEIMKTRKIGTYGNYTHINCNICFRLNV